MIDVSREVSAFKPVDLTRIPEIYKPATEQMRTSFILYNKALHEVQLGHEDIAKNYLRKAVTIFPDFYDAVMVLGILVFANGDRIGAVRIFNSVKDSSKRAESIGLLDHLVEEAEKPTSSRMVKSRTGIANQDGRKLASVMGGELSASKNIPQREATYSRGQVFERRNSYYEPQPTRRSETRIPSAPSPQSSPSPRPQSSPSEINRQEETTDKDINEFRLLNKYLLIIVGVLLVFLIVLSTLVVNKTAENKKLTDKISEMQKSQIVEQRDGGDKA